MQFTVEERNALSHYGILRRSGRYPWGSGGDIPERSRTFLDMVKELLGLGMSEAEIAESFGMTTKELRETKTVARAELKAAQVAQAQRLQDKGMSTSAIGRQMGLNESTVRGLLAPGAAYRSEQLRSLSDMLREQADNKTYVDVGKGVEISLGISGEILSTATTILKDEGYSVHTLKIPQAGTTEMTTYKVLVPPGVTQKDAWMNRHQIQQINVISNDNGATFLGIQTPLSIDSSRIAVRYAEDGGANDDGTMWVRPGVDDVSLGGKSYAQVRVAVDGTHYLKGMAVYKDDLPPGVDIMFNTNKSNTGNKLDAMKPMAKNKETGEIDKDNPFGAVIKRQMIDLDSDGKERVTSVMNIVNEEGDWGNWEANFSSQMLSKQSTRLAKQQLDVLYEKRRLDFDELDALTNPEIKRKLLLEYADAVDADAVQLQAASFPRTAAHVLIPMNFMKETEIYAPNFNNGERVALVRHPHGGIFEIPELVVNNRNPKAKKLIGLAPDAVGINHKVAERLSGADFDGDHVLVIPNDSGQIRSIPALAGLKNYDPKAIYKLPDDSPIPRMTKDATQLEMGKISNLITDMTILGAPQQDIVRAVRHSMTVIDAEKHGLNYRQSELDNGIKQLRAKYPPGARGAATLISRARSPKYVPEIELRKARDGGPIDKKTGEKVWVETGRTTIDKNGKSVLRKTKVEKLAYEKDAFALVSDANTDIENVYATHSNRLKALANEARKEAVNLKPLPYNPSAKAAYANEVASLNAKLNIALENKPRERQAQLVADQILRMKQRDNPDMTYAEKKKISGQALVAARARVDAKKKPVEITPREWEAIQAGAITPSRLREILANTSTDQVKKLATPRTQTLMTSTMLTRARSMAALGYTQAEISEALGVSLTTLKTNLSGGE